MVDSRTQRYAACVEYCGSGFSGWQKQRQQVDTVQCVVENALTEVADHPIAVITAGRTDARVHATHQVIHFDTKADRKTHEWLRGANRFLPSAVRLRWVTQVQSDFHARFSARSRTYRYIIYNHAVASAILAANVTHIADRLHVENMKEGLQYFLGQHDFTSFRAAGCQAHSAVRSVSDVSLNAFDCWIWFDIKANAFLQHMVRNIAGALIAIGRGHQPPDWINQLIMLRDRTQAALNAPACGLYLIGVEYPEQFSLPSKQQGVSFWGNDSASSTAA